MHGSGQNRKHESIPSFFFETTQMLILVGIRVGELREWKKILPIDADLCQLLPSFS